MASGCGLRPPEVSQCTEGLGGEKGAERVAKVRRLRREGALCPISDGGCTRVKELEPLQGRGQGLHRSWSRPGPALYRIGLLGV